MLADPSAQVRLLDIQDLDSRLDALRHQARNAPENTEITALTAERAEVDGRARDLQMDVDDLTRDQRRADSDVEAVKSRKVRDQQRLDSGAVKNPKDLEHLQHELVSLTRRISELEDTELEIMELLEAHQIELTHAQERVAAIDVRLAELTAARTARIAVLRTEGEGIVRDRAEVADSMPVELLGLYDKLRASKDGVGAALLRERRCSGCSLQIDASELGQIAAKPANEVVRCEECGRILVRTSESGL